MESFKVFVNNWLFSLCDSEELEPKAEPPGAIADTRDEVERKTKLQELFWLQLELKRAETYVSAGHRFTLATREKALYQRIAESLNNENNQAS